MRQDLSEEVTQSLRQQGIAAIALADMDAALVAGCERSTADCDPPPLEPQIDLLSSSGSRLVGEYDGGANLFGVSMQYKF